jgi:uncharacterized membrane protein YkoI
MKKKTVTICKTATMFITAITLASIVQAGMSFAGNNGKEVTNGSIMVQQEESAYPGLAQITLEQAKDVALANIQGEVLKIELEEENGFLVYGVEIVTPEKIITDIKIDAGNGGILLVEKDTADTNKDSDNEQDNNDDEHEDKD